MNVAELETKTREELVDMAKQQGVEGYSGLKKQDLIMRLVQAQAEQQGYLFVSGVLDLMSEGYGFLRQDSLLPGPDDIYISNSQIRRFGLRSGDTVSGQGRPPKEGEKYCSLIRVEAINGLDPEQSKGRRHFTQLTPTFPDKMYNLETDARNLSTRLNN
jgi:transcription termination factor Rho